MAPGMLSTLRQAVTLAMHSSRAAYLGLEVSVQHPVSVRVGHAFQDLIHARLQGKGRRAGTGTHRGFRTLFGFHHRGQGGRQGYTVMHSQLSTWQLRSTAQIGQFRASPPPAHLDIWQLPDGGAAVKVLPQVAVQVLHD
jgi:hypothetical protein